MHAGIRPSLDTINLRQSVLFFPFSTIPQQQLAPPFFLAGFVMQGIENGRFLLFFLFFSFYWSSYVILQILFAYWGY